MQPLLIIRSERGQMSAIERRIADFILENTHLLRDYSSQQLANALGISQSSVVKFSQKLGFKGYPDLKFSIGEAVARNGADADPAEDAATDGQQVLSEELWRAKGRAEEETRLLNPPERIDAVMDMLRGADKAFVVGTGEDGVSARAFAIRLSLLGFPAIHHYDPVLVPAEVATSQPGDLLILFSERGQSSALCQLARLFQKRGGKVVSVTRHTANPLRAHADAALVISAHDPAAHVEQLLYRSSLQSLLDFVFVLLCQANPDRHRQLAINLERIHHLLES